MSKSLSIDLLHWHTPAMRAFHLSWLAFFVCFFAWFAPAPLMPLIKAEFHLNASQVANMGIAAVAITILARLVIGPLCDRFGPRLTYTALLLCGAVPVLGTVLAQDYRALVICRVLGGIIGASFVITQYQTTTMFAPNVVGTANAMAAGFGNAGGGLAQTLMPLLSAGLGGVLGAALGWRLSMVVPGVLLLLMAWLYWRHGQDCPEGNYGEMRRAGVATPGGKGGWSVFRAAAANHRVWLLAVAYGGCFGVELFMHGVVAIYYVERFGLDMTIAGFAAGGFGLLALFARALGGMASDGVARIRGLDGRTTLLLMLLCGEALGLLGFSMAATAPLAVAVMLAFGLCIHMACGATYALMPFIDRSATGGVAGIIGAGGNVGAVLAGLALKGVGDLQQTFAWLGGAVLLCALCAGMVRFSAAHKQREEALFQEALLEKEAMRLRVSRVAANVEEGT